MTRSKFLNKFSVLLFTFTGILVMGYHPGIEDDGVYLAAIKSRLDPMLYPRDADFFRLQLQASQFDTWMAWFSRMAHLPVGWAVLLVQFAAIFLVLWAGRFILRYLFEDPKAVWGGVALLSAMLTLPVAGTALYIADQHLHPRILATALAMLALTRILKRQYWLALPLLLVGFLMHPIMGAFGFSFAFFLWLAHSNWKPGWFQAGHASLALALPLSWLTDPPTTIWHKALESRQYMNLYHWEWYEWLGALAPILLFGILWRVARGRGDEKLSRFALAVFAFAVFQQLVAFVMLTPPQFIRLLPLQPMRYLQLVYIFLLLLGGALLGKYLLRSRIWLWCVYLLLINLGMFVGQQQLYPATAHFELPGFDSGNKWLQAFDWIRNNTPVNAYFALDPRYLKRDGEDYHSFRALAERSQMADDIKDTAVVVLAPSLGPRWERETDALANWQNFKLPDFERLKRDFGVDWVLVDLNQDPGLDCRWHNGTLAVCKIP